MVNATIHHPKVSVRLIKIVRRNGIVPGVKVAARYGQLLSIDLTPYLGEQGRVTVHKSVKEPCGGFCITFADKAHPQWGETIYALVEPMDLIEIRMAHNAFDYPNGKLPIVMRGFVTEPGRFESMDQSGHPSRGVRISGQDYGKILECCQIIYQKGAGNAWADNIIDGFKFLHKYGGNSDTNPPVAEFVADAVRNIVMPYLAGDGTEQLPGLIWWRHSLAGGFSNITPEVTAEGTVSGGLVNSWPGGQGVYHLLAHVCDVTTGFNEMFVEDREEGVYLVLRPTPWKTPTGDYIQHRAKAYTAHVNAADVVSINVSRSDAQLANMTWVQMPGFNIWGDEFMRLATQKAAPLYGYDNNKPQLYGFRQLESYAHLGPPYWQGGPGDTKAQQDKKFPDLTLWMESRRHILESVSKDAVLFERGTIRLKGNEWIKAGWYLELRRGQTLAEYYVAAVTHDYAPYQPFLTTCQVERGTGFIERAQRADAPYFAELTPTPQLFHDHPVSGGPRFVPV